MIGNHDFWSSADQCVPPSIFSPCFALLCVNITACYHPHATTRMLPPPSRHNRYDRALARLAPLRYAKIFLCDNTAANCQRICVTSTIEGETVTWNYCCTLGLVTAGQYTRVETWDSDWLDSDELGGHVTLLLEQGDTSSGTFALTGLGSETQAGSSVDLTVIANWS